MGIGIHNLTVRISDSAILSDIDCAFQTGRVCAILGPNGAGKSTLLKAITGLMPATTGQITLDDNDFLAMPPKARAKTLGYLPQDYRVAWDIEVRDVVALGRYSIGTDAAAVARAMEAADITQFAARTTGGLSGGELARVMLARVLAGEPQWILADEPLASLDPAYQVDMSKRFRSIAKQGVGVVIVLHDINLARRIADDIVMLKDGKVHHAGTSENILNAENLSALYDIEICDTAGHFTYI